MSLLWQLSRNRFLRFAAIGGLCLVIIQLPVMGMLEGMGMSATMANAGGFIVSTIANFVIQRRLTFSDCRNNGWQSGIWKFGGTSLVSLGVNSIVFDVLHATMGWLYLASLFAALFGSGVNFTLSRIWTFKNQPEIEVNVNVAMARSIPADETESVPELSVVRELMRDKKLAFFMPAHNEAENLPRVVPGLYRYLSSLGMFDFRIFIINDGSTDDTRAVAEELSVRYREIEVQNHAQNMGYGAALMTGCEKVVATGMDLWAFFDGDGQFAPQSLGTLLVEWGRTNADLVVGRRIGRERADSRFRHLLGRAWHYFSLAVMGRKFLTVHDVDCGFKGGRVKALAQFADRLSGQAAAISPELIARTNMCGQTIAEVPLTHLPRKAGESSGGKPLVMIRSAWHLLRIGMKLRVERMFGYIKSRVQGGVRVVDNAELAPARAGK